MKPLTSFAAALLLIGMPAGAQWHLNFPTQAACADAAASVVGSAGGTTTCTTSRAVSITVPVNVTAHGAKCDGTTDDQAAITRAIAAAKARALPVLIPAGACAYSDVINLDGVKLVGTGDASVLYALNPLREVIFLRGSGSEVRSLRLTGSKPPGRKPEWEGSRIVAYTASNWVVDNVTIDSSTGTGIQTARESTKGTISNNRITDTMGDSIHITDGASYITITGNTVQRSGDDGIAVVSYQTQKISHHVVASGNLVSENKGGRSMSVVGGSDVIYAMNRLSNSRAACLYLAQEGAPYNTYADSRINASYNTLTNCGSSAIGHAAVMLFTNTTGFENAGVTLTRNDINSSAVGAIGVRVFGQNTGVKFDSNRITATEPMRLVTPGVVVNPYVSGPVGAP